MFFDRAGKIRVLGVDFRIDHSDRNIFPGCDLMRLFDLQLAENVLRCIAARVRGNLCGVFLQCEQIVGLGAGDQAFVLDRADCICDRTAAGDLPAIEREVNQREALGSELRHAIALGNFVDLLRCGA